MSIRHVGAKICTALAIALSVPAYGQQVDVPASGPVALQQLEPTRFALIIGNADYSQGGMLPPIGTACQHDPQHPDPLADSNPPGDADVVADAFTVAGWNIEKVCNQDHVQLGALLQNFVDKVGDTDRAFGVVYFSGHGAEIAGHNYLFGVDANFDPVAVANKYKNNPRAVLFGNSAVDLEGVLGRYPGMSAKGIVVVIDACRDNPVLDQLRNLNVDMRSLQYPGRGSGLTGVVLAFATSAGKRAPAGQVDRPTVFASEFAAAIKSAKAPAAAEIEPLIQVVNDKIGNATHGAQMPRKIGDLHRPPAFCISGCASPADQWANQDLTYEDQPEGGLEQHLEERLLQRRPMRLARDNPRPRGRFAPSGTVPIVHLSAFHTGAATGQEEVKIPLAQPSPSSLPDEVKIPLAQPSSPSLRSVAEVDDKRAFAFDIYWCSGDATGESRHGKARAIKARIDEQFGQNLVPSPGYVLGSTRVIGLPIDLATRNNISGFILRMDVGNEAERSWGEATKAILLDKPRMVVTRTGSPDRISIYVCNDLGSQRAVDDVYFQVPLKSQLGPVVSVKSSVEGKVDNVHVVDGTQTMGDRSPNETQIRYFFPEQQGNANAVAAEIGSQLGHPVEARLTKGFEKALAGRRVIEVWVGKNETSAAVQAVQPQ